MAALYKPKLSDSGQERSNDRALLRFGAYDSYNLHGGTREGSNQDQMIVDRNKQLNLTISPKGFMAIFKTLISALLRSCRKTQKTGCVAPSRQQERIDVYRETEKPNGAFKEIALLTANGRPFEHHEIQMEFIRRARELGADAVLLFPAVKKIEAPSGWGVFDTFRYLASVIVYDR